MSLLLLPFLLVTASCGDDDTSASETGEPPVTNAVCNEGTPGGGAEAPAVTGEPAADDTLSGALTVFAAASLTDAFTSIGDAFMALHPDVAVTFNYAGSSALREQILAGAPADVFASANTSNMDQVVTAGAASDPQPFVDNLLEIAVPAGNPGCVESLDDFANPDLLIGLCAPEVPCGQFGLEALENAGVTPSVDTEEPDVRSLLTKVESGDLDAGIVYVTDVLSSTDAIAGIEIPEEDNVVATYPIAPITASTNPAAAAAFVDFVLSDDGQAVLAGYGFDSAT
jgi:molybdate transport system substrate-binding protein